MIGVLLNVFVPPFYLIAWALTSYASITMQFWIAAYQMNEIFIKHDNYWDDDALIAESPGRFATLGLRLISFVVTLLTCGLGFKPYSWPVVIAIEISSVSIPSIVLFSIHVYRYKDERFDDPLPRLLWAYSRVLGSAFNMNASVFC